MKQLKKRRRRRKGQGKLMAYLSNPQKDNWLHMIKLKHDIKSFENTAYTKP